MEVPDGSGAIHSAGPFPVGGEIMCRTVGAVLALLLVLPAARADDKPKDKPLTPQEQYKALLKEQQDAMKAYQDAFQKATTAEEKRKVREEMYPKPEKAAPKFLELAEKNPKAAVAVDALVWVVTNVRGGPGGEDSPRAKAVAILLKEHVQSEKMGPVCQSLAQGGDKEGEELLRGILEKNPHKGAQGLACLSLAQRLKGRAEQVPESQADEADKLRKESEELFERAGAKYGGVKLGSGTVGAAAKTELFELRHLSVGKEAPDIVGQDADGKKFKLSDYRGKVVLLDFWGNW
jgi:hypothetical protein